MEGNRVRFYATAKGPHDLLLCHSSFGMTQDLGLALDNARLFLSGKQLMRPLFLFVQNC